MSITLTTPRLLLQVEDSSKSPSVLEFYNYNRLLFERFEPTRPHNFYTIEYQTASMDAEYNNTINGKMIRYYIYLKNHPDCIIGAVNFSNIMHGPFSRASIGYKLDQRYHGNGYAFEACSAAIPEVLSNYKLHRLDARVSPENIPSIKLLERLGFVYEGIEYQGVEVNGFFQDHYMYGLISTIQ